MSLNSPIGSNGRTQEGSRLPDDKINLGEKPMRDIFRTIRELIRPTGQAHGYCNAGRCNDPLSRTQGGKGRGLGSGAEFHTGTRILPTA